MTDDLIARASTRISAPVERVWHALTDAQTIRQYMFGTTVKTDWKPGSRITWSGEWQGKPYEDRGEVLEVERNRRLRYSHFSPLMGKPDKPENYHHVTVELQPDGTGTRVSLEQDGSADAAARDESQRNWQSMLEGMKQLLEGSR